MTSTSNARDQTRTYDRRASVVFLKTKEAFGGLSNMAGGYPLRVNGVRILTSEALYQACRFPHMPDVQRKIIDEHSPMTAKMRSKPFRNNSRPDWDAVRVKIMKWCLRVKLAHHWSTFGKLLLDTGDRPIVEQSRKDDFWGAKVGEDEKLVGMNVLGRLLMELREEIKSGVRERSTVVLPLEIPDFLLFGQSIERVGFGSKLVAARTQEEVPETDFQRIPARIEAAQKSLFEPLDRTIDARAAESQIASQSQPPTSQPVTIDGPRPYDETKPSGLPWLGDIPAHWDVRRNGRLFGARRETGFPELPVLEVSLRTGVRIRDFDNGTRKQEMSDRSKYQRAMRGDIAYNMMRMWQGAVGIAPTDGLVSPAYVVARPFIETDTAYYAYLFRTAAYMREVDTFSRGIVKDRNRLYWESFKQMPSVYPPLDEQRLIVRFLDWHGAQTAKLIRAKKKVIALLNEQKQAIIHRTVTRGLNPNVRFKPSGIPWLGDVPEGWEVKPVLACYSEKNAKNTGMAETTVLSLSYGRIIVKPLEKLRGLVPESFETYQIVEPGNIIIRSTDLQNDKKSLRVGIVKNRGIITSAYMCLRTIGDMTADFGYQILNTYDLLKIIYGYGSGLRQNLGFVDIRRMPVPLPPPEQQFEIVRFLELATADASEAIEHMGNEIALIQEFRTRLIADVVTGKLDVRAAAASLPETAETELIDELSEDDDLDETENEEVAA